MKKLLPICFCTLLLLVLFKSSAVKAAEIGDTFSDDFFEYIVVSDTSYKNNIVAKITGYSFSQSDAISITIPAKVKFNDEKLSVAGINDFVFYNTAITEVTIEEGIHSIGKAAFAECSGLKKVSIPQSCTTLSDSAFYGCTALKTVVLGSAIKSFGSGVFSYCNKISSLSLHKQGKYIALVDGAIYSADLAVLYSAGMASGKLVLPSETVALYNYAFEGNTRVTSVVMSDGFKYLMTGAFCNAKALKSVSLGGTVSIMQDAFAGCQKLTSIKLPSSLASISGNPFIGCTGLTSIKVDSGNKFFVVKSKTLYDLNKTRIIYSYTDAKSFTVVSTVVRVESGAFYKNPNIETLIINSKNEKIFGAGAFYGCNNLKKVIMKTRKLIFEYPEEQPDKSGRSLFGVFAESNYGLYFDIPAVKSSTKSYNLENNILNNSPDGVIIVNRLY